MSRFLFLAKDYDDLYRFCADAEKLQTTDPKTACGKVRLAVEWLLLNLVGRSKTNAEGIQKLLRYGIAEQDIIDLFYDAKDIGNEGVHIGKQLTTVDAHHAIDVLIHICIWFVLKQENKQLPINLFSSDDYDLVREYCPNAFSDTDEIKALKKRLAEVESKLKQRKIDKETENKPYYHNEAVEKYTQKSVEEIYEKGCKLYDGKHYDEAFECFVKAADCGHAEAQARVGYSYNIGKGTTQNLYKAFSYYKKAAESGFPFGCYALGNCYENGIGTEEQLEKAIYWYTQSAEAGYRQAMNALGDVYSKYLPIRDLDKAAYWYSKAVENGYQKAENSLKILKETNPEHFSRPKAFHCTSQGTKHIVHNKCCCDASTSITLDDFSMCAVCSDGKEERSDIGAKLLVLVLENYFYNNRAKLRSNILNNPYDIYIKIISDWQVKVSEHLRTYGTGLKNKYDELMQAYRTSLLLCAVIDDITFICTIGRGSISILDNNGLVTYKDLNNEDNLLGDVGDVDASFIVMRGGENGILLFSSGVSFQSVKSISNGLFESFSKKGFEAATSELRDRLPQLSKDTTGEDISVAGIINY